MLGYLNTLKWFGHW